jgi:hypothetical protein
VSAQPLRILADERFDFAVSQALRADGFDGVAASEVTSRSSNRDVIEQAGQESRRSPSAS